VQVHAECDGAPTCADNVTGPLQCCEIPTLFFRGLTAPGALTPNRVFVQGVVRGCAGDPEHHHAGAVRRRGQRDRYMRVDGGVLGPDEEPP
jgi:hypothetical protein